MLGNEIVSIITPAYNAAGFIHETISSVIMQSCTGWEMLIADDCSHDATREVIRDWARKDTRIKPIFMPKNGGPAMARNAALAAAHGRYIAFLDADDLWLPDKLSHQLAFMQEKQAAFSFTQFRRINADGARLGHLIAIPERIDYAGLLKNTAIATSTVVVDRERTGPFEMIKTYYDDYALWLMLLKRGIVAHGLQKDLMRYRVVRKSVSRHKMNSARWVWRTYRDIERLSLPAAAWCFLNYTCRAYKKYARF